jgi:hypothetical protein
MNVRVANVFSDLYIFAESSPITWDAYSLKIDGERVFWRAGELAPWRLPTPALWKDVFEKSEYHNIFQQTSWEGVVQQVD